jgi:hypothetical protein
MAVTLTQPPTPQGVTRTAIVHALALVGLGVPMIAFYVLRGNPNIDVVFGSGQSHFYVVGAAAALAFCMALSVIWSARTLPDSRTFFLAMAFVAMSTIFLAHGMGTSPFFCGHGAHTGEAVSESDA